MKAFWLLPIALIGCGLFPQKISISDPEIKNLFSVAETFPREKYGFSSLPTSPDTDIRIEHRKGGSYDIMLHIYGQTSRTIAFQRTPKGYKWIHEQEIFRGEKFYETPDGRLREQICITYEIEPVSASQIKVHRIDYSGEDSRLADTRTLTLEDVIPILVEWGYKNG